MTNKKTLFLIIVLLILAGATAGYFVLKTKKKSPLTIVSAQFSPTLVEPAGFFTIEVRVKGEAQDLRVKLDGDDGETQELILTNIGPKPDKTTAWSTRGQAQKKAMMIKLRVTARDATTGKTVEKAFPQTTLKVTPFTRGDLGDDSFAQLIIKKFFTLLNTDKKEDAYNILTKEAQKSITLDGLKKEYDNKTVVITTLTVTKQINEEIREEDEVRLTIRSKDNKNEDKILFFELQGDLEVPYDGWKITRISQNSAFRK